LVISEKMVSPTSGSFEFMVFPFQGDASNGDTGPALDRQASAVSGWCNRKIFCR